MKTRWIPALLTMLIFLVPSAVTSAPVVVFSTDFENGLPPEFSAPGSVIQGVQGYAGLGPVGRQFGGSFLRYTSVPLFPTRLTVRNLPAHDHLSLKHLLALIDSWDSTEIMQIAVDGTMLFAHRFSLAQADTTTYSPAPPGAILSMGRNLGFSNGSFYFRDRAYDLGAEPAFLDIPHTADSVQVVWSIGAVSGPAATQWQGGSDESWAIDAVRIEVSTQNTGVAEELAAGRLAVAAWPNPASPGSLRLRFALPSGERATIEMLDLAGRRIASSEVGSMGTGQHSIRLTGESRLAPGLYFARLRQGAASRTARVVVSD